MSLHFDDESQIPEGQSSDYEKVEVDGKFTFKHKTVLALESELKKAKEATAAANGNFEKVNNSLAELTAAKDQAAKDNLAKIEAAKKQAAEDEAKKLKAEYEEQKMKLEAEGKGSEAMELQLEQQRKDLESGFQSQIKAMQDKVSNIEAQREREREMRLKNEALSTTEKIANLITTEGRASVLADSIQSQGFVSFDERGVVLKDPSGQVHDGKDLKAFASLLLEQHQAYKEFEVAPTNQGGHQAHGQGRVPTPTKTIKKSELEALRYSDAAKFSSLMKDVMNNNIQVLH